MASQPAPVQLLQRARYVFTPFAFAKTAPAKAAAESRRELHSTLARFITLLNAALLTPVGFASDQRADLSSVVVSELKYGNAKIRWASATGTHIGKRPVGWRLGNTTHEIPLGPSSQIGYQMKVESKGGETLQLLHSLEKPNGEVIHGAYSARSGSKVQSAFHFHKGDDAGRWILRIYVVGIDKVINEVGDQNSIEGLKVVEVPFDVYLPEGAVMTKGFHEYGADETAPLVIID